MAYTAGGGSITPAGEYIAGGVAGVYQVIATGPGGIADTSDVTVAPAPIARVTLRPGGATVSRVNETTRFTAAVWNTLDAQVSDPVTYETTCGTVTGAGVFTAPTDPASCLVTATSGGKSDTTEVLTVRTSLDVGIPFGSYDLWPTATKTQTTGGGFFTSSHDYVAPGEMVNHLALARAKGLSIVLAMTGGAHDRYKTGGVFDEAKWRGAMDAYNTPAIQTAIADGVADGTILGNSVMDEPQQSGSDGQGLGASRHSHEGAGGRALRLREGDVPDSRRWRRARPQRVRARQFLPGLRILHAAVRPPEGVRDLVAGCRACDGGA